jgi:phosphoribosyl-ATP pyrophosphohydrolase/phosphoribosyl-AMP cyclohydrolase/histidinol dehydrogenase
MAGEKSEMPELRTVSQMEVRNIPFEPVEDSVREVASNIIDDVKAHGEAGLLKYAWRFKELPEGSTSYVLGRSELESAFKALPQEQQGVLERTAARIRSFAAAQRASVNPMEVDIAGGRAGQVVEPIRRAGCYAPGGRYPLPSSVLMTACTARAAGVAEVVVASPSPT